MATRKAVSKRLVNFNPKKYKYNRGFDGFIHASKKQIKKIKEMQFFDLVELDVSDILENYVGLTAHEYAVRICELFGIPFNSEKLNARPVKSCTNSCRKHDYKNHISMLVEELVVVDVRTLLFYIMNNLDGYDEWAEKNVKNDYYEGRGRMHRQYFSNLYSFCKHKKIAWFSKVNQRRQQEKYAKAKAEEEGTNK